MQKTFLAANPSATVQEIKRELAELIKDLQASGNVVTIKKLEQN
jgi:diacylglycerol kinase family enzyme